jgi:hypothetical protein
MGGVHHPVLKLFKARWCLEIRDGALRRAKSMTIQQDRLVILRVCPFHRHRFSS